MYKSLTRAIGGILMSIVGLIFSFILCPVYMGSWAIICVIGLALTTLGAILSIVALKSATSKPWVKTAAKSASFIGICLFIMTFLIWVSIMLAQDFAKQQKVTEITSSNKTAIVETDNSKNVAPVVNQGLNVGKYAKFLVESGDCFVGDIAIINSDGTREPLYDNEARTALITVFNKDTWVYAEWGGFHVKKATTDEIARLIKDKEQDVQNYDKVIQATWPTDSTTTTR